MMSSNKLLIASLLGLLAACSNSSGSSLSLVPVMESEPNDSTAQAGLLRFGQNIQGSLTTIGDTDWWQVDLRAGDILSMEVFANRFDQSTWVAAGNVAKVTLYDTDGTTEILHQNSTDFDWGTLQDTDVLAWRVPTSGTYFIEVGAENGAAAGGDYLVSVKRNSFQGNVQFETEANGASGDNDTDLTAESLTPGVLHGWHVDDETDFYSFAVTTPSLLRFTMSEHRNGFLAGDDGVLDPEIYLYDSGVNLLALNDDTFYLDSAIQYIVNTPDTYFIEVNECCNLGDGPYQMTFERAPLSSLTVVAESEPNDDTLNAQAVDFDDVITGVYDGNFDYFAFSCNAGDRIHVEYIGIEGASFEPSFAIFDSNDVAISQELSSTFGATKTILATTGTYYVVVGGTFRVGLTTPYAFRVRQTRATYESEPNDQMTDAIPLDTDGHAAGVIDTDGDLDVFSFTATEGIPVVLDVLAGDGYSAGGFFTLDGFGSIMDPALVVRDENDNVITSWDSAQGILSGVIDGLPTASLVFVPPATGTYFLEVSEADGDFGVDAYYTVQKRQ